MTRPRFDFLRRHSNSPDALRQAMKDTPALRQEVEAELALIAKVEKSGRCVTTAEYAAGLRQALEGGGQNAAIAGPQQRVGQHF